MSRTTADNAQMIMPSSHQWVIFKELYENKTQHGEARVNHLTEEWVYRPNIVKDITEFVTTQCHIASHIASKQTQTGNPGFPSASCYLLSYVP